MRPPTLASGEPRARVSPYRAALVTAVATLLIAGIGLGSWWTWGRHLPLSGAVDRPPVGEEGRYPGDRLAIADLGGAPENYTRINDLAGVRALNMLTESELSVYDAAGPGRAKVGVTQVSGGKATVLLVRVRDPQTARSAAGRLTELQLSFGFRPAPGPPGVAATTLAAKADSPPGGRAHYNHGDIVARVELRGRDQQRVHEQFDHILRRQVDSLPADD